MNIIVCIKQVPGTSQVEIDPETGVLKRDGVESKINPHDLYALEMAMQLRERFTGTVRALSMGPMQALESLEEAVYMGVDEGLLVSDRRFGGADVLATAYTLSQAVEMMAPWDIVICGKQSSDGDTAQVGAECAEFLNTAHLSNVTKVEDISSGYLTAVCSIDNAVVRQRLPLPCLICTEGEINTPRLPSYKRKLEIRDRKPVRIIGLDSFKDRDEKHYGLAGSPTQVERVFAPEKNTDHVLFKGDGEKLSSELAKLLADKKFI